MRHLTLICLFSLPAIRAETQVLIHNDPFAKQAGSGKPAPAATLADVSPTKQRLARYGEQALGKDKARDAECYRLLWCRTFHNPVCLRLDTSPDGAVLTVKRWAGKGGYDWGALTENKQVKLSPSDFDHFRHLLASSGFWNAPFDQPGAEGADGSEWTMEGLSKNQYRAIDRPNGAVYDPERITPWRWLINRAGLTFASPGDIY